MYYFIADEYYDHKNVIKYQNRPFKTLPEMNEIIINRHNEVVKKDDKVIHAGDFCFSDQTRALEIISTLNGIHFFLTGDHDRWLLGNHDKRVNRVGHIWCKMIEHQYIVVCHYAMHTWPRSHYNSWHLYSHSHKELNLAGKRICISVETNNYYPYSSNQIKEIMKQKPDNPNLVRQSYGL